jgi:hypothetical protein
MKNKTKVSVSWLAICGFCVVPLWTSCQAPHRLVLEPVGPKPVAPTLRKFDLVGVGFLTVYSATEMRHGGKDMKYYPHSDYSIYTEDGKLFQQVENSTGPNDEMPAVVPLPAGRYKVRAQDDDYGRISVPVLVQGGETTTVNLEAQATPPSEGIKANDSVRLPDGRLVGWRAREPIDPSRR